MYGFKALSLTFAVALGVAALGTPAQADGFSLSVYAKGGNGGGGNKGGGGGGGSTSPTYYSWMSPDVQGAWSSGYQGQGTTMTFVDDFTSKSRLFGNLGTGIQRLRHGEWTSLEGSMIAPMANIARDDFNTEQPISLAAGFNVVNLSYGFVDTAANYTVNWASQYPQEQSIIAAASQGLAVISKSAGNDSIAVGTAASDGTLDYLGRGLIGTQSAIFVGSLDYNGTSTKPAPLSYYSNYAGTNTTVQKQFLVVGVDYNTTGLAGTSFAAPIVSGYAAILSSKFTGATPTQVANQLLNTARTDTLVNYNAATYGRGEASLANALAPSAIQ